MHEIHVIVDPLLYQQLRQITDAQRWTWKEFLQASVLLHSAKASSKVSVATQTRPRKRRHA